MRKFLFLIALAAAFSVTAEELKFFESEPIEYWKKLEIKRVEEVSPTTSEIKPKLKVKRDQWDRYLKPKSIEDLKEVFREGEHTPPLPLLMGIQNPTYQNAQNWLKYIRLKNSLSRPFLEKIRQIKMAEKSPENIVAINTIERSVSAAVPTSNDWDRFRFRMYFDSKCPHCKNMFNTLSELKKRGFYVEAVQVDSGEAPRIGGIPMFRATPAELKKHSKERIPFTVVADMKRNRLVGPIRGYHSINSVESFLNQVKLAN